MAHGPVGDAELLGHLGDRPGLPVGAGHGVGAGTGEGVGTGLSRRPSCFTFTSTSSNRRAILGDHEGPADVRAEQGPRGVPHGGARLRRGGGRAARRRVGPGAPLPGRPRAQDGRPRAVRPGRAGGVRRRRVGDFTSLCVAIEELGRVDQSIGITLSAGVGLGINPILTYGTQEQKERFLPDLVAGRALAALRPHRARGRVRRRCDPHQGACSTATSGSSTAPRPSSPTAAPTSRPSSP